MPDEIRIPVNVGKVTFKNPFYVASGPTAKSVAQLQRIEETGWAAASLKLSIDPPPYINRKPRYGLFDNYHALAFTAEKRLTFAEGLQLVEEARPRLSELILMANITYAGDDGATGWVNMARRFEQAGADIIELNMCCPNMSYNLEVTSGGKTDIKQRTGASMGQQTEVAQEIVSAIRQAINIPLFVKLTPEGGKVAQIASALYAAGADAVGSTANRLGLPPIDLENPKKSAYHLQDEISMSCYSSSWLKPLAQRDTYEMRKLCGPQPVIAATGGITNWRDAVEMVLCGGNLLGICAETLISGFDIVRPMIKGMKEYMDEHGYSSLDDFRGQIVDKVKTAQEVTLHDGYARITVPNLSAPCKVACPHHVPAQAYVQKVAKGEYRDAFDLITGKNPLQDICGLVCTHPCEDACTRGINGRPIPIRAIKRFVLEYGRSRGWPEYGIIQPDNDSKVAVIGSGPAGLSCAVTLRQAGYAVTIFEKSSRPGGMMRVGIPAFRLAKERLDAEIDRIAALGIEIKTGHELGSDFALDDLFTQGYAAIFLGTGASEPEKLDIPGEDTPGVYYATEFLSQIAWSQEEKDSSDRTLKFEFIQDKKVVVAGSGYSAIDAARAAIRLGASQVILAAGTISKRQSDIQENLQQAVEEGVKVQEQVQINLILAQEGCVSAVGFTNSLGLNLTISCDTVILAGKMRAGPEIAAELQQNNFIKVDNKTGATKRPGVYAGGDAVRQANIITAITAGKKAAVSIDRYVRGDKATLEYTQDTVLVDKEIVLRRSGYIKETLQPADLQTEEVENRIQNFVAGIRALSEQEAVDEARRCLNCGCGEGCQLCKTICCEFAPDIVAPDILEIDKEKCVACGMCYLRCPAGNIKMVNTGPSQT